MTRTLFRLLSWLSLTFGRWATRLYDRLEWAEMSDFDKFAMKAKPARRLSLWWRKRLVVQAKEIIADANDGPFEPY